jgi:hypothetical protein
LADGARSYIDSLSFGPDRRRPSMHRKACDPDPATGGPCPGSLLGMEGEKRKSGARGIWRLVLAVIGVIAIIQELRKPKDQRTWHGKVADFVPYDFRMPTIGRVRDTYWNPEGPIISGKVFGVGWAPNLGALTRMATSWRAGEHEHR